MGTQDMGKVKFSLELSKIEADVLRAYAQRVQRTQADVMRGFIWSLMTTREKMACIQEGKEPLIPTNAQFLRATVIVKEDGQ